MKKDFPKESKAELRKLFKLSRARIPSKRRTQASFQLLKTFDLKGNILSFASFGTEIDLWPLNFRLAQEGRLFLPKIVGNNLVICPVTSVTELSLSKWGILEPTTSPTNTSIDYMLVPGLAFDKNGHRLGYGKGHYDRLEITSHRIGIAFHEQFTQSLSIEDHDKVVEEVLLF